MTSSQPAVFVVEDHPVVRRGIESLISTEYRLVGSADEANAAVELISERKPDLVLLDVHIPGGGGGVVVEESKRVHPDIKFLVFSISATREDVMRMFTRGVDGYILKTTDETELLDAIAQTLRGGRPISREIAGYLLEIDDGITESAGIDRLSPKEREVVTLIARGYTYKEVAASLSRPISIKTLETHISHIFEKLGVASRHEVTRIAFETGFVNPDSTAAQQGKDA